MGFGSTFLIVGLTAVLCGCSGQEIKTKIVFGEITLEGEKIEGGWVRFVPIGDAHGPASTAEIINSQYRIEDRGGVPLGKHRVEVEIQRKTDRKVPDPAILGGWMEELARVSPDAYAGKHSPLEIDVKADSDGRYDLNIPRQSKE